MAGAKGTAGAAGVVERPALYERLSRGSDGVTLVSARAGSGKSALLRGWVAHAGLARRTGWVSVERDERDAQHFWLAVVEELRNAIGDLGFVERLAPTPEFDGEQFVRRLLAELGSLEDRVVLVIDDLQELSSDDAHRQLELLLDQRPRWLRMVLASRHDPRLALHRLRLAGALTEIRGADLRFEFDEAKALLELAGVVISDAAVSALVTRTEGWAAGLRLAALLLVNHPDPERRAAEFSGSERTIAEYLLAEVLDREAADTRRLLLRTSIVDRVNGSLADRLAGATGSERLLLDLERRNAFVESVDAEHIWFRYPRLFGELLRLELRRSAPEDLPELQRVAAAWCDEHGLALEAIEHAQAAEDWHLAARLLAGHAFSLALDGQTAALGTLLGAFPADALTLPELAPALAYYELAQGSLDSAAAYVSLAERRTADVPVASLAQFELSLAVARLDLARRRGDFSMVRQSVDALLALVASGAIDDVSMGDDVRALGLMMLGITELWSFGFSDSEQHLTAALTLAMRTHRPYIEVVCRAHLALAALPRSAELTRERATSALAAAESHGWGSDPITTNPATAIALAEVWQGRSSEAAKWLERADESVRADVDPITAMFVRFTRGMQLIAAGRLERAISELESAHALQAALVAPQALAVPIVDYLVLTLVRLGRLDQARELITHWPSKDPDDDALAISTAAVALASSNAQEIPRHRRTGARKRREGTLEAASRHRVRHRRDRPRAAR